MNVVGEVEREKERENREGGGNEYNKKKVKCYGVK